MPQPIPGLPNELALRISDYLHPKDLFHLLQALPEFALILSPKHITRTDFAFKRAEPEIITDRSILRGESSYYADPDYMGNTILHIAATNGDAIVMKYLLTNLHSSHHLINIKNGGLQLNTPLSLAAWFGHEEVVKLLLANPSIEANCRNAQLETPLSNATRAGNETIVRLLLDHHGDVDPNSKAHDGATPLMWAAFNSSNSDSHAAIARLLLSVPGVDPMARNNQGNTPLRCAAMAGCVSLVEQLLERGVDVNAANYSEDVTPLMCAAARGHTEVAALLLKQADIKVNHLSRFQRTALGYAAADGNEEIVDLLLSSRDDVDVNLGSPAPVYLAATSWAGGGGILQKLLAVPGVDVNARGGRDGGTPLIDAADGCHVSSVGILLDHPDVDVNAKNKAGMTALHVAAYKGNERVVNMLLDHPGINVDCRNLDNETYLEYSSRVKFVPPRMELRSLSG
ncbi:hypothetical protein FQN50_009841 [Emmonsiellopsis sp. PD_5]|nr:hypothetical protein FQN50_009841 [Emmonsiellopsis sp. PD_5]